ncbi:hypothetical protein H072_8622 [Dactylellina haptotyla CBS 200.50]|uniref:Uncharacterized protein n=1 Tax=Dactylellina haptotyla (strain CBS 200.50) TaxID=1284197 RepID=S8A3S4_DACHA|nr:hypothetical protein H072_8622 [Dactylellina haptotyla CBS 200.50]
MTFVFWIHGREVVHTQQMLLSKPLGLIITSEAILFTITSGLMIDVVFKDYPNQEHLKLCKPLSKKDHFGLQVISPSIDKFCTNGSPIWYWDLATMRQSQNIELETDGLIQITSGPDTKADPGITNSINPDSFLLYANVDSGAVFRSFFKVRRGSIYVFMGPDDDIRAGDTLEFWGPSEPENRKLYLHPISETAMGIKRKPYAADPSATPEVELRVRTSSSSTTKSERRTPAERLAPAVGVQPQIPSFPSSDSSTSSQNANYHPTANCLTIVCQATAKGVKNFVNGAKRLFTIGSRGKQERQALQRQKQFFDDLVTFGDDRGTGRSQVQGTARSRPQSQITARSSRSQTSANQEGDVTPLSDNMEGPTPLPRLMNLGPLGVARLVKHAVEGRLTKVSEATHEGVDTPGVDTRGLTHTHTIATSRPDTQGHFGSEILISPKSPLPADIVEEDPEGEEETDDFSIHEALNVDPSQGMHALTPPIWRPRAEGGPGASKSALEMSRISTTGSNPAPLVDRSFRRLNGMISSLESVE